VRAVSLLPIFSFSLLIVRCSFINNPTGVRAFLSELTVRPRLEKIIVTFDTLYSKLASDSNHYTPICRLPDDLLLEIWDHLSLNDRLQIPAVSRRFRSVALASGRLWRFIDITPWVSPNKTDALLARAATADLHLYTKGMCSDRGMPYQGTVLWTNPTSISPAQLPIQRFGDALVRCTVLVASINSRPRASFMDLDQNISVTPGTLERTVPRLRSFWLTDIGDSRLIATPPIPFPLFGGHTHQLRHVQFVRFSPQWTDPLFSNLTYLRLIRPISRLSVPQMLGILKRCPNLHYLFLCRALSAQSDGEHLLPLVALPLLRHLSIVADSLQSIVSLIEQLHTSPYLRFGISSTTFLPLPVRCIREDTPWELNSKADELIISGAGFEGATCSVVSKKAGVMLAHFSLDLVLSSPRLATGRTALLVDPIRHSNLPFQSIKRLRFQGLFFGTGAIQQLVGLFPCLEVLEIVNFSVKDTPARVPISGLPLVGIPFWEIVGKELCPNLRELRIALSEYGRIEDLVQWLNYRNNLGYQPLEYVTVYADQPLGLDDEKRMGYLVENIQWRNRHPLFVFYRSGQVMKDGEGDQDQDEDPLAMETERAISVPQHAFPYLGEDPPDYFSIPE